jgi:hypothetical protein
MKSPFYKILASLTLAAGLTSFLGAAPSVRAQSNGGGLNGGGPNGGIIIVNGGVVNAGNFNVPDGGASVWLLALGCSGLAIAARKRFKRS